ncbi:dihydrodipicolinate synthase family protein [Sphingobacterium prati]|uniref:dihydrodipicolinate synthase family protein n=2 Tax=Sphingobacterium prati TaxID=2737006 RepID=UPI001553F989|nr:dihydrodipicolinate synthase family protein [Sphingobacterium prati]NPE46300.1 N-acetylneuraminate lyase [Sphingobacterium prati]
MEKKHKIKGLIAAAFANYDPTGNIDLDAIPAMTEHLVSQGLRGIFICGTNGEGPSLSTAERMAVAERYIKAIDGRILSFVHVGHSSIAEAKRLAAHAESIGADYISAVSAFYFKPSSVENLVDAMAAIAAAAPHTPFYYYHIPAVTGLQIDMLRFLALAEEKIPTFQGVKYTAATLHEYQACLQYKEGKYDILFGYDELLLPALAVGATGAIGSTYNYAAPLYLEVIRRFNAGDHEGARNLHFEAVQMVQLLVKYGPIPVQRAIMKKIGLDLGQPRLPLTLLDEVNEQLLLAELEQSKFLDHVALYQ